MNVELLDAVVVERLFFHIKKITDLPEYNKALEEKRHEKERAIEQVKASLASIPIEQERLIAQLSKTESESVQRMLLHEVENLDKERKRLTTVLPTLQKEHDEVLRSLDVELLALEENWQDYPFEKRIALLNFLIYAVEVDLVSPRWLRIRVTWLREEWGCEQMYMCRHQIGGKAWTQEEEDFLIEHFPTAKREVIINGLPHRSWQTVRRRAYILGLRREIYEVNLEMPEHTNFCVEDFQFMRQEGIATTEKTTKWTPVSIPTFTVSRCAWG